MEFAGPVRRVLLGPDRPRPPARWSHRSWIRGWATPAGLLALVGLILGNATYLIDTRGQSGLVATLLSAWAVLPILVALRRPLLAWRLVYPLTFVGVIGAGPRESWPWPPVQIVAFLAVLCLLAFWEETAVIAWVTALNIVPVFLFSPWATAWGVAVLFVAIALAGDMVSRRRRSSAELARQAELTELEQARRAVLEERTRIAREMHDVVAHHMSMIAVQAETAPYRITGLTVPVRAEFDTIAAGAREALTDMRRLLGVLRAETEESPRAPQPGLADLAELIETTRRAGVPVEFTMTAAGEVPEGFGLAAYRIVQEALANAARHAPGGPARVTVRGEPDALAVEIENDAGTSAAVPGGPGHGLVGMRERAALLGGTLEAGPRPGGGFRVVARLPVREVR
jgi:signal transduction histidine kinase